MSVTVLQFFTHLISNCGGIHETKAVTIQASTMKLYDKVEGIPQYINILG